MNACGNKREAVIRMGARLCAMRRAKPPPDTGARGAPPPPSQPGGGAELTLKEKAEKIRAELGYDASTSINDVIITAKADMQVEINDDASIAEKVDLLYTKVFGSAAAPPPAPAPAPAARGRFGR